MKRQYKWIAFLIGFALMFALGVESTPLSERAIVAGLGIDYENDRFIVSAQILLPSSNDSKSSGIAISSAEGKTIGEALAKISSESSMLVAMSHCNLVLLGENLIQDKAYTSLDYMVRNAYLSENALILTTYGSAKDILSAKTAYSDMTSFYIQRELMVYGNYKEAVRRNIKEYLSSYYTHNSANWLTKVKKVEAEKPQIGGSTENGGKSANEEPVYVFDFSSCAIIKGNNFVFVGGEEIISGINFVHSTLDKGDIVVSDNEKTYCFYIIKSKSQTDYEPKEYLSKITVKLDLILKEVIAKDNSNFSVTDVEPSNEVCELVKGYVCSTIENAFYECKSKDVDIFNLYEGFYGKLGKEWLEMENDYLKKSKINVEVKLSFY